jgi:hypothetical protein
MEIMLYEKFIIILCCFGVVPMFWFVSKKNLGLVKLVIS